METDNEPVVNIVVADSVAAEVHSILKPQFRVQKHPYAKFVGSDRSEQEAKTGRTPRSVTLILPKGFKEKETSRRPTLARRPRLPRKGLGLEDLRYVYRSACQHYHAAPLEQMDSCLANAPNALPPSLVSLDGAANISFEQFLSVCEVLIQDAALRSLDLTGIGLRDQYVEKLCNVMVFRRSVMRLSLANNTKISVEGMHFVEIMLSRCVLLNFINLSGINMSSPMALRLKDGLPRSRLQTLVMNRCGLKAIQCLASIISGVALCASLQVLSLVSNDIPPDGGQWIAMLLKTDTQLSVLDLRSNRLGDRGISVLAGSVSQNHRLEKLLLSNNDFHEAGAIHLFHSVRLSTSLSCLDAGQNDLSSTATSAALKALLVTPTKLRSLVLNNARITNEGAIAVSEALAENKVLAEMDLRGNAVTTAGLLAFSLTMKLNRKLSRLLLDMPIDERRDRMEYSQSLMRAIQASCQYNNESNHLSPTPPGGSIISNTLAIGDDIPEPAPQSTDPNDRGIVGLILENFATVDDIVDDEDGGAAEADEAEAESFEECALSPTVNSPSPLFAENSAPLAAAVAPAATVAATTSAVVPSPPPADSTAQPPSAVQPAAPTAAPVTTPVTTPATPAVVTVAAVPAEVVSVSPAPVTPSVSETAAAPAVPTSSDAAPAGGPVDASEEAAAEPVAVESVHEAVMEVLPTTEERREGAATGAVAQVETDGHAAVPAEAAEADMDGAGDALC